MFALKPCDASVFETAPTRYTDAMDIPRPASEVWKALVADDALGWCRMLGGAKWTSPRPFGVGTTRTMHVAFGTLVIDETFFHWEEGRRKSFYVNHANLPLFRYFAEDYLVETTPSGGSRFTWTLAGESTPIGATGAPILGALCHSLFKDTRAYFNAR
jgi:hypothetical protein